MEPVAIKNNMNFYGIKIKINIYINICIMLINLFNNLSESIMKLNICPKRLREAFFIIY